MKRLSPREVARRRVIDRIDISHGKGVIVANGRTFSLRFDDLLDLVQAVEMIMLKLTGKVLRPKFRPEVTNREALKLEALVAGDYDLGPPELTVDPVTPCEITERIVKTHYMNVKLASAEWHNWFGRLDELVKCLYGIVRDAQGAAHG